MMRVKVKSKSELVENKEGKSAPYRCNQGYGNGYFSNASASASTLIASASASTNKKRKNER